MVKFSKKKNYVSIKNYVFLKPTNFIESKIYAENSVKLVNFINNITIFGSVSGRDGDYCKEIYDLISKDARKNLNSKLISRKVFKINQFDIYNVFIKKNENYESIYLVCKNNKSFRFSFIINKSEDNTLKIFENIVNSLKKDN